MCELCITYRAWFKIFVKQNTNIFRFSHTFDSEVCYCTFNFQQTNKNKVNLITDNHIKFEVSLHFGGIWPTVCQSKLDKKIKNYVALCFPNKVWKKILKKMGESVIKALELWNMDNNDNFYGKEFNLNFFYMHTNFEQKYPKT